MTFTTDTPVTWQYLDIDAQNQETIAHSRVSVAQLIQEKHAHGWSLFSTFMNKPIWRQNFYGLKRI